MDYFFTVSFGVEVFGFGADRVNEKKNRFGSVCGSTIFCFVGSWSVHGLARNKIFWLEGTNPPVQGSSYTNKRSFSVHMFGNIDYPSY